ncbi:MAG: hypothetical protein KJ048_17060 [Dehalococcoidia bacterium]|nr:hypothetical protein [Dehalococcoidia bacterium]
MHPNDRVVRRTFSFTDGDSEQQIVLELELPRPAAAPGSFGSSVRFRVIGEGFPQDGWTTIFGIDEIDALLSSLDTAAVHLRSFADYRKITLRWLGDTNLGLPKAVPYRG